MRLCGRLRARTRHGTPDRRSSPIHFAKKCSRGGGTPSRLARPCASRRTDWRLPESTFARTAANASVGPVSIPPRTLGRQHERCGRSPRRHAGARRLVCVFSPAVEQPCSPASRRISVAVSRPRRCARALLRCPDQALRLVADPGTVDQRPRLSGPTQTPLLTARASLWRLGNPVARQSSASSASPKDVAHRSLTVTSNAAQHYVGRFSR